MDKNNLTKEEEELTDRIVTKDSAHRRDQIRRMGAYITLMKKEREKHDKR